MEGGDVQYNARGGMCMHHMESTPLLIVRIESCAMKKNAYFFSSVNNFFLENRPRGFGRSPATPQKGRARLPWSTAYSPLPSLSPTTSDGYYGYPSPAMTQADLESCGGPWVTLLPCVRVVLTRGSMLSPTRVPPGADHAYLLKSKSVIHQNGQPVYLPI